MEEQTERMYQLMKKESNRLKTFQMNPPWPKDYVDIKKLAKAGFFYAFNGDNVHCAFCRGQVCRWDRDDDPMSEHARHFTTCPFIMGGDVGNEPLGEDPFPGPKRPRPYDVCGIHSNSEDEVQREPSLDSLNVNSNNNTVEEPNIPQHGNDCNNVNINNHHPNQPSSRRDLNQNESNDSNHHQDRNQNSKASHHTPAYGDLSTNSQVNKAINETNNHGNSNNLSGICKICYTNAIELVFLPCGHSVSCLICSQNLYSCPYCRAPITTRIRTFLV